MDNNRRSVRKLLLLLLLLLLVVSIFLSIVLLSSALIVTNNSLQEAEAFKSKIILKVKIADDELDHVDKIRAYIDTDDDYFKAKSKKVNDETEKIKFKFKVNVDFKDKVRVCAYSVQNDEVFDCDIVKVDKKKERAVVLLD